MSTDHVNEIGEVPDYDLTLPEIGVILIRHFGLKSGLFDVAVQMKIGTGAFSPDSDNVYPSAIVGVSGIGLKKVEKPGPNTVDASTVSSSTKPKPSKKRT